MPQLCSALRVLGRHTVMKSALESRVGFANLFWNDHRENHSTHVMRHLLVASFVVALLAAAPTVRAQGRIEEQSAVTGSEPGSVSQISSTVCTGGADVLAAIDGPPPPIPPEVISRDEQGRATVRAIKLTEGIRLDGQLDEPVYHTVPPISGFIQQTPDEGAPASESTQAWVMFDGTNLYVGARCYDSAPPSEWVANDMRRDTAQLRQNDTLAVILDTFYDRRNGVAFYTNPLAARADFAITNEGNPNSDWNPVWDVRTGRFDGGWTVEMEIPFKSLRYRPGPTRPARRGHVAPGRGFDSGTSLASTARCTSA